MDIRQVFSRSMLALAGIVHEILEVFYSEDRHETYKRFLNLELFYKFVRCHRYLLNPKWRAYLNHGQIES